VGEVEGTTTGYSQNGVKPCRSCCWGRGGNGGGRQVKARSDLVDDERPAAYTTSEEITDRENNNKIDTATYQSDAN
jgi:hypothetical protein